MKTRPKQILGYLPLGFVLPALGRGFKYNYKTKLSEVFVNHFEPSPIFAS